LAFLENAAGQGHAYAMNALGNIYHARKDLERKVQWFTKGAEAGLPAAMFHLGNLLDEGQGVVLDHPAAVEWYRRAAEAGHGLAAVNLCSMYIVGRGRAWWIVPAMQSPHCSSLFLDLSGVLYDKVRETT